MSIYRDTHPSRDLQDSIDKDIAERMLRKQQAEKKEAWIQEYMRVNGCGRERAEKKYMTMKRHGLV